MAALLLLTGPAIVHSQTNNPYILNGDAAQDNCNCYTLTTERNDQFGSIWNRNRISLTESFNYIFNLNFGCKDSEGADGIAFVLQPIGTSIGTLGSGIGYEGVTPSVGVVIDTWQNFENNDPPEDHITIHLNGNLNHSPDRDLSGPVSALAGNANIEDCQWHTLRVIWDANARRLSAEVDGVERVAANIDLIPHVFNNDPMVYWGFTAATGGSNNHQRVCTSLNPSFYFPEDQTTCFPQSITFIDSSASFGTIDKWFWDFGDGTKSEEQFPPPHQYPAPGEYWVKLAILGNDGCVSDTFVQKVVSGSKPTAGFSYAPFHICPGLPVTFSDSSKVTFGTIDSWSWKVNGQEFDSPKLPPTILSNRENIVELTVGTAEGCLSETVTQTISVSPRPCPEVYVPSAFTPNNDGKNDFFEFIAVGMNSIEFFGIYNRYGQLVFSSRDPRGRWDGRFKGIDQPSGGYVWVLRAIALDGTTHYKKGTVALVR